MGDMEILLTAPRREHRNYHHQHHPENAPINGYKRKDNRFRHAVLSTASRSGLPYRKLSSTTLPENFKYLPEHMVNVRDQGQCGSCWAFGIATALADRVLLTNTVDGQYNLDVQISVQRLLKCVPVSDTGNPNPDYCDSGNDVGYALNHLPKNALIPELLDPYKQINGGPIEDKCPDGSRLDHRYHLDVKDIAVITGNDTKKNVELMKQHIYQEGPIMGAMLALTEDFHDYDGTSIFESSPNAKVEGGHCIEILGWGKNPDGNEYWICRNSWGANWPPNHLPEMGKGWFYIKMGVNMCKIEEIAYSAVPVVSNANYALISKNRDAFGEQYSNNPQPPLPAVEKSQTDKRETPIPLVPQEEPPKGSKLPLRLIQILLLLLILYSIKRVVSRKN